jgi:GT2 family glycosyltransferase
MDATDLVSIIIVTWNPASFIPACLEALAAQTYPKLEIIIVDNASQDGCAEWVRASYPQYCLLEQSRNLGFAAGFNRGARAAAGEWLLSVNPDLTPEPDFVSQLLQAVHAHPRLGMAAPKLLRSDASQRLDSTGLFVDRRRRPYDRGQMQIDRGQYDDQRDIFGACGAAALFRKSMLDDIAIEGEYFDEDFFAYGEDADLAWRANLRGWRACFVPQARALHGRGWGDTLRKRPHANPRGPRLALRNRYLMSIKNDRLSYWLVDFPWIASAELPRLAYLLFTRPAALLGLVDLARLAPAAYRKRRVIRASQTVADAELRPWFARSWNA